METTPRHLACKTCGVEHTTRRQRSSFFTYAPGCDLHKTMVQLPIERHKFTADNIECGIQNTFVAVKYACGQNDKTVIAFV